MASKMATKTQNMPITRCNRHKVKILGSIQVGFWGHRFKIYHHLQTQMVLFISNNNRTFVSAENNDECLNNVIWFKVQNMINFNQVEEINSREPWSYLCFVVQH